MNFSPYVNRLWLAAAILDARKQAGYTTDRLSQETGIQRQKISHIETANRPVDPAAIRLILDALRVAAPSHTKIMQAAERAAAQGWWKRYDDEMGPRQAQTADLEAGAGTIFEYQPFLIPGLLQTPDFARARADAARTARSRRFSTARALEARKQRQAILSGPAATPYEVVIDETALRRRTVTAEVMHGQLEHLIDATLNLRAVTVRVLPLDAVLAERLQARSAFSYYTYSDPEDFEIVTVDTNIDDMILTDETKVGVYACLRSELQEDALSAADSLDLLAILAQELLTRR
ncbi:transcriptional regulator with XRE-family HTH domain [Actinoplanes campanulatus]|uniref:Transcriptional regulator with XRE-family HTH domain n=1 Tax=Actinoplanes campanulatus TaxID=113559 RepID=A0A7W5AKH0_9ACTN|nr:helix-turn-helix transcriptional regulator [Actinoplanes campanulatus]MBB3097761.1 transcriptional regulator with XRE-family HTH domain [Actinoplanes campanulatus]GGN38199.1 transcriptional regulator [Actinoplanes campanulatus]